MNEHIEWFKRFSTAYMRWVNFSFDRIAADVVKKHSNPERQECHTATPYVPFRSYPDRPSWKPSKLPRSYPESDTEH